MDDSALMTTETMERKRVFDSRWKLDPATGCWLWTGTLNDKGYGVFTRTKGCLVRSDAAHRHAWVFYRGPIPAGLYIDHICRVRSCVNPDHLRVVTPKINSIENSVGPTAKNAQKTQCEKGHDLTGGNLRYVEQPNGARWRVCRQCKLDKDKRLRVEVKEARAAEIALLKSNLAASQQEVARLTELVADKRGLVVDLTNALANRNRELAEAQKDGERWRAVAPTLTTRNHSLESFVHQGEEVLPEPWRKTWLESREPLNGRALTVEQYADALIDAARQSDPTEPTP